MLTKKKETVLTKKTFSKKRDSDDKKQFVGISSYGKKIILFSIIFLVIGFVLLKFTDSEGTNWASTISPFIIILSYIGIAIGIIYPKKM
ncbi:MAG: hypothetical protein SNJ64_03520 [Endomicrobiia bacterium]